MKAIRSTGLACLVALGMMWPMAAQASSIDFTQGVVYGGANGQTSFAATDHGVLFTFTSSGGKLTQTADGFGVDGTCSLANLGGCFDDPGEIGTSEMFSVALSPSVSLYEFTVRQLFPNEFITGTEQGKYRLNGGAWQTFAAFNSNGFLTVDVYAAVNSIDFAATKSGSDYSVSEFEIGSRDVPAAVPEPASLALLGSGLLGIGRAARRRRAARTH